MCESVPLWICVCPSPFECVCVSVPYEFLSVCTYVRICICPFLYSLLSSYKILLFRQKVALWAIYRVPLQFKTKSQKQTRKFVKLKNTKWKLCQIVKLPRRQLISRENDGNLQVLQSNFPWNRLKQNVHLAEIRIFREKVWKILWSLKKFEFSVKSLSKKKQLHLGRNFVKSPNKRNDEHTGTVKSLIFTWK